MDDLRLLSYLAGYLDGKGCITSCSHGKREVVRITIVSHDEVVLKVFDLVFSGGCRKVKHGKKYRFRWCVRGSKAQDTAKRLMPFLLVKKKQAELIQALTFNDSALEISESERVLRTQVKAKLPDVKHGF